MCVGLTIPKVAGKVQLRFMCVGLTIPKVVGMVHVCWVDNPQGCWYGSCVLG